jgi:hypothetical protein
MLCDLSLLVRPWHGKHERKHSQKIQEHPVHLRFLCISLAAHASPSTFAVGDMIPKKSAMITSVTSPYTPSKRARLCLSTSESASSLEDMHPCSSPPHPLFVFRTAVTLQRVTQNSCQSIFSCRPWKTVWTTTMPSLRPCRHVLQVPKSTWLGSSHAVACAARLPDEEDESWTSTLYHAHSPSSRSQSQLSGQGHGGVHSLTMQNP